MPVRQLSAEVARKIAAGEVIDRPNAIVRELLDNAVDSGATRITVEIDGGGIEKIRIIDNGCGMSKEDLQLCAHPHATSKITTETDLLHLTTLGFRGEALSSMAAVGRLQITSGGWRMNASVTEDHLLSPVTPVEGTIVQMEGLFENFPARRVFLKRPASEALMCRATFIEKVLPRPDIAFSLFIDGEEKINLPAGQSLIERFVQCCNLAENEQLFYELRSSSHDKADSWSYTLIIGEPSVTRNNRKDIFIYVNGRKISEYPLVQAIEYGCQGYFPNGMHPVACLFMTMEPSLVDFNIHPAKREARFKDTAKLHHDVSSTVRSFFKQYTVKNIVEGCDEDAPQNASFAFSDGTEFVAEPRMPDFARQSTTSRYLSPQRSSASYSSVSRGGGDMRSSFFGNAGSQYEKAVIKDFSQGMDEILSPRAQNTASVEGHDTKPNYLPDDYEADGSFHFVGSTLGTFLIAEKDDVLYIIDQHAAHERYLYNKIMEDEGEKQSLLVPYTIQTNSAADDAFLEELQPALEAAGFTGRQVECGLWEFSTVPVRWKGTEEDLAHDLLDKRINPHDMINAAAASTACRSAVMDGTVLDSKTAAWIAEEALKLPDPHCPHGRPVYTSITRRQLFTLVKRI